jgi:hypothetical protein
MSISRRISVVREQFREKARSHRVRGACRTK